MTEIKLDTVFAASDFPVCEPGPDGTCAICADEAQPGRVVALLDDNMAAVELAGRVVEVALDLVDEVKVGDILLIHLGFAITKLETELAGDR